MASSSEDWLKLSVDPPKGLAKSCITALTSSEALLIGVSVEDLSQRAESASHFGKLGTALFGNLPGLRKPLFVILERLSSSDAPTSTRDECSVFSDCLLEIEELLAHAVKLGRSGPHVTQHLTRSSSASLLLWRRASLDRRAAARVVRIESRVGRSQYSGAAKCLLGSLAERRTKVLLRRLKLLPGKHPWNLILAKKT